MCLRIALPKPVNPIIPLNIVAIIPARGGSKGIPGKNLRTLASKPLVGWTIEAARNTASINRVIVSTDDAAIESAAQSFGAEVVRRPAEISGDQSASELALLHVLKALEKTGNPEPDLLVFLQCTSPLTLPEDIEGTIQQLHKTGADSAFAAVPFHYFLWRETPSGDAVGINHEASRRPMRQEREPLYLETGAVYVMRVAGFLKARHRFFGKTVMHVMPASRCLEIDEPEDLIRAEMILKTRSRLEA